MISIKRNISENPCLIWMTACLFWILTLAGCSSTSGSGSSLAALSEVASVTPDNGSSAVSTSGTIAISFNKEMDTSSINSNTFLVTGPEGKVSGRIAYSAQKAIFSPTAPLLPQTKYTATITADVRDTSGKALASTQSWIFTTGKDQLSRPTSEIIPSTLFGQHMHRAATTTVWPVAPFGTWRLWDAYVAWPNLEPNKGNWQFQTLDSYVSQAEANHVEIVLPLGLSPQWASARPTETSAYGQGNAAEPANIEDWKTYVTTVATRYKGKIHYYELWNEINLTRFYSGTTDEMVMLAREAYTIIKGIDPTATVLAPSFTGSDCIETLFQEYIKKGGMQYADIVNFHFYVMPNAPEKMMPLIQSVNDVITRNNLANKPLWNTESGWNIESADTPASSQTGILSNSQAAAFVARAYIVNWALGVNRFYWYAWDNYNMGLIEKDGKTIKAPAIAYSQTYSWLSGARMVSFGQSTEGMWVVRVNLSNGNPGWIVWSPEKTMNLGVPEEWQATQLTDLFGNTSAVTSNQEVTVGQSPVLLSR